MKPSKKRIIVLQQRIDQVKAEIEELQKQKQQIDLSITQYHDCLVTYGGEDVITIFAERDKCVEMRNKLGRAEEIVKELQKRIPSNFKYDQSTEQLVDVVNAIKKLQERRELLQKSIDELSVLREDLINDRDTYLGELQNARIWAREIETEQANSSKDLIKQLKETQKNIREQKAKSNECLQGHEDKYRNELNELYDLDVFNDHYRRAIPAANRDLEAAKKTSQMSDGESSKMFDFISENTNKLDEKLNCIRSMMTERFNVQQLRRQNEEIHANYKVIQARFNQLKTDTEDLIKNVKESIATNNGYQQQIAKKEEVNTKLNFELEKIENEVNRATKNLEQEKSRFQAMDKEYQFLMSQNMSGEYGAQIQALQERKKIVKKNQEDSNKSKLIDKSNSNLQNLINQYKTNSTAVDIKENTVNAFKDILNSAIGTFQEFSESDGDNQISEKQKNLDEILKNFRPPAKRGIKQFNNPNYSNPEFQKFMTNSSSVVKNKDAGKDMEQYVLDYSTEETFYNSLFDKRNQEYNFIEVHIFTWHNLLMDPIVAAESLLGCANKLKQNTLMVNGGTNDDFEQVEQQDGFNTLKDYITKWIELFPGDFQDDKLQKNVESIVRVVGMDGEEFERKLQEYSTKRPTSINPPLVIQLKKNKKYKTSAEFILSHTARVFAEHFTYVELDIFNSIGYYEFTKTAWSRQDKEKLAPNLVQFTHRFNKMSEFIAYTIVQPEFKGRRKDVLERWIEIMEEAYKLKNFNLIFEIDGALNKPSITRLESLMNSISKRHKELYEELTKLTSPFKKFGKYKDTLRKYDHKESLPYPGPWLTEMTFVQDGNQTSKTDESNQRQYNISKNRYYYQCVTFLKEDWGFRYNLSIDNDLKKMIVDLEILPFHNLSDNVLYQFSEKIK